MSEGESRYSEGGLHQSFIAKELLIQFFGDSLLLRNTFTEEEVIKVLGVPFYQDATLSSRELTLRGLQILHRSLLYPLSNGNTALHVPSMITFFNLIEKSLASSDQQAISYNIRNLLHGQLGYFCTEIDSHLRSSENSPFKKKLTSEVLPLATRVFELLEKSFPRPSST